MSLFTDPPRLPLVAPSILSADFARMEAECRSVLDGGADLLHVDVMDGHFVQNLTMGPDMVRALRRVFPEVLLDVHLMVTDPRDFIESFAEAGASHLTVHVESELGDISELCDRVRSLGLTVGLALNPDTPVESVLPHLPLFDLLLVMSVHPGRSGQAFIESSLAKTRQIRAELRWDQRLEMDGGVNLRTAPDVRAAGCDVLAAASAVFGPPPAGREEAIQALRGG